MRREIVNAFRYREYCCV